MSVNQETILPAADMKYGKKFLFAELKVITMNMWGIHMDFYKRSARMWPFDHGNSQDRTQRIRGAAETILSTNYDFVMLQVQN